MRTDRKFTPKPWFIHKSRNPGNLIKICNFAQDDELDPSRKLLNATFRDNGERREIAQIPPKSRHLQKPWSNDERDADARLIEIAPDMYDLLEELAECGAIPNEYYRIRIRELLSKV